MPAPRRILYLTPGCFDRGGISRYSRYQATALRDLLGHDRVRVLSVLGPDDQSFEAPFDVQWYAGGIAPRQKAAFVGRVLAEVARHRPDALWSAHVNLAGLARAAAGLAGARTFLNTYGVEVWSGFRRDAAWGLRATDHVLADCHFTARYLEAEGLRPRGSVEVVWDCVDLERFSPGAPRADTLTRYGVPDPAAHVNVLTLGRLSRDAEYKGYARLLDAFARIHRDVPALRLVFAGRGDLVEPLRAQAATAGVAERVHFTGAVHEADLADVYRAGHVFSLVGDRGPGRGEGIPLTPLEAAACGLPLLVGNQDGSAEAVVEGETGFALDPFDLDALAARLRALATDPAARARLGAAARRRTEVEFAYSVFRERHAQWMARG